jgi:nicotinamidase-related amidase
LGEAVGLVVQPIDNAIRPSSFWSSAPRWANFVIARNHGARDMRVVDQKFALLVIDMQKGFDEAIWGARNNPEAEACVALLAQAWRQSAATVVHVHHQSTSSMGCFRPGTQGIEPKPQAIPRAGEVIYHKRVNSAFIGTSLETDLRKLGIENLVIVGLTTNHCVSTTARMAGNLGFETYVVADATATFDRAGADGRLRPAAEVHNAALGDLHGEFAEIIDTKTVIAALTPQGRRPATRPARDRYNAGACR